MLRVAPGLLLLLVAACGYPRPTITDDGGDGSDADIACTARTVARDPVTISIMLDRSGSMIDVFPTAASKFAGMRTAVTAAVTRFDDIVAFGGIEFDNSGVPGGCPELVTVAPAMASHVSIDMMMATNPPNASGVLPEALVQASTMLSVDTHPGAKVLWVITDGVPWQCDSTDGTAQSVAALTTGFTNGIATRVVALGPDIPQATLQQLANAGAGGVPGGSAGLGVRATTTAELDTAMHQLVAADIPCVFGVTPAITDAEAPSVIVTLAGTEVPHGPDGWMASPTGLTLVGAACTAFHMRTPGTHDVTVDCR